MSTSTGAELWTAFIKPFADAVGKSTDEVTEALKAQIGDPSAESIELLKSEEFLAFDDIKAAFTGVPVAKLKKAVKDHLRARVVAAAETPPPANANVAPMFILPQPPDDRSWLEMLKTGGVLKPTQSVVISGIRAALASRTGLYDVPKLLVAKMEEYSESLDEPVGEDFFKLRKLLTTRSYSEIFSALGVEGSFATEGRRNKFLTRLDTNLWPTLSSFNAQLKSWSEAWQTGMSNPGIMMGVMASALGRGNAALPASMLAPPATDGLRDAADSAINEINKCFSGTSIPVAMALAYDALQIRDVLENPKLPSQIGAATRDQMLKNLGVAVPPNYPRLEQNLTQYALAVMDLGKVTGGEQEQVYLQALLMLGHQIPWELLAAPGRRTPVSRRPSAPRVTDDEEGNRY